MIRFYAQEYRSRVKRLLGLLLPLIATELAMFGMNFFDASMSGQAGAVELAGTAMAGNFWMPFRAGLGGALMACTPIVAQLIGAGKKEDIPRVVQQGFFLAFFFAAVVLGFFVLGVDFFYEYMELEPDVIHVAYWYGISVGAGVLPFFLVGPLRSLVDSLGHTDLSMKIFLAALPINAVLNYIFIFGLGFVPAYGGIGAGIATGITYWIIFFFYAWSVYYLPGLREYGVFRNIRFNASAFWEYLRIGIPLGCCIFLECGCFALTAFLIAKFGTAYIAADMAATNFCTVMYMIPCSISLAVTILVGIEVGAKRFHEAHVFSVLAVQISLAAV
ncbi:MAG: MATE family efflux transporter, partial [Acidaminococcaceae bacterium]|nr:MATE family efflux transporter [Acidaminococcaceae bacterium]